MYRNGSKPRFRTGMAIALTELRADKSAARQFNTDMLMNPGYIGFMDNEDVGVRCFIFKKREDAEAAVKSAKEIGFRATGMIADVIHVKNADLERPHLKYVKKDNWYKELYK